MRILTKEEYYSLARQLHLGNWSTPSWNGHEWLSSRPSGRQKVAVRALSPDSDLLRFDLTEREAAFHIQWAHSHGLQVNVSLHAPDHRRYFAGEVMRSLDYIDLTYTTVRCLRLREAKQPEHCQRAIGIHAVQLMRANFAAEDWDDLQELWDMYPDAVIEFACYEIPTGVLNRRAIFWEVRDY